MKLFDHAEGEALKALLAHQVNVAKSRKAKSDIQIPAPEGLEYLDFQKAGIEWAAGRQVTFIFDEMGLGKTIQSLGLSNFICAKSILCFAPKSLLLNWKKETSLWSVPHRSVSLCVASDIDTRRDAVLISYSVAHRVRVNRAFEVVIIDEAQFLKNPESKRTKAVLSIARHQIDLGARIVVLSGTPILNRPIELWPLISRLCPEILGGMDFGRFIFRYCAAHRNYTGHLDYTGSSNAEELQEILRSTVMIRRLKEDVLAELPAKIYHTIILPSDGVEELVREEKNLCKKDAGSFSAPLEALSTIRKDLGISKVATANEDIDRMLLEKDKIIVFAIHKEVIKQMFEYCAKKGYLPVEITGDTKLEDRQAAVDTFQNDPTCRVFLGNIQAAGVGITLTAASTVYFVELPWTPAEIDQASDRAHRIGQKHVVDIHFLIYQDSVDAMKVEKILDKRRVIYKTLDKEI